MSTPGQPQPQSSASYVGQSDSVLDFVGRFLSIKQHQKAQAFEQMQSAMSLSQAGFPIDVKAFSKMVKKSGIPIATDEETLRAFHDTEIAKKQPQKPGALPGNVDPMSMMKGAPQPMQAPDGSPDYVRQAVDAHNKITSSGKPLDAGEEMGLYMNVLAGRARQLSATKSMTEQEKAGNELMIEQLKHQAGMGDPHAAGKLMAMGGMTPNVNFLQWSEMPNNLKTKVYEMQAGAETDAEKAARGGRITESLVTSGRVTDPAAAAKIGDILAHGGTVPPDLQGKIKPYTFSELADTAKLGSFLQDMGVKDIGHVMAAAQAGGLENALPAGMKSVAMRQLELEQTKAGFERLKYEKELEIAARMDEIAKSKAASDQAKQDLETFRGLVEIKKLGQNVPDEMIKGAQVKAARALNMDVREVDTFWNFLTGGTKLEFTPRMTEEGKSTVDKFTGKQGAKKEGTLEKIGRFIKEANQPKKGPI